MTSMTGARHTLGVRCVLKGILAACLLVVARGCLFRPGTHLPGAAFNRGTNAAWLGVEWVAEPHSEAEIVALSADLTARQLTTVYVFTTYRQPDGTFNPTYDDAATFVPALKRAAPELDVQAWIGLPLGYVNLEDAATRTAIAEFCATLVREVGFDGVHLDPEPVHDGDGGMLALLEEVRAALGPGPRLSLAGRRIWPLWPAVRWPAVGRWTWSAPYYREVVRRVDQVAVMVYDSALPWAPLYRQWVRFQVIALSRILENRDTVLFIGVPTSEERTFSHRPAAETMASGLAGVIEGLNDAATRPAAVTGVAIYPYWETDAAEWETYTRLWLGHCPPELPDLPSPYPVIE